MKKSLKSLDIEQNLATITLSDEETKLEIPKLSASRLIKIVKYLGVEVARLWDKTAEIGYDSSLTDQEKLIAILEFVPEEKLLGIVGILTDLDEESALLLDINEILDIFLVYAEKTNLPKTFLQIRNLYKVITKKELPSFKEWLDQVLPRVEEQEETKEIVEVGKKA